MKGRAYEDRGKVEHLSNTVFSSEINKRINNTHPWKKTLRLTDVPCEHNLSSTRGVPSGGQQIWYLDIEPDSHSEQEVNTLLFDQELGLYTTKGFVPKDRFFGLWLVLKFWVPPGDHQTHYPDAGANSRSNRKVRVPVPAWAAIWREAGAAVQVQVQMTMQVQVQVPVQTEMQANCRVQFNWPSRPLIPSKGAARGDTAPPDEPGGKVPALLSYVESNITTIFDNPLDTDKEDIGIGFDAGAVQRSGMLTHSKGGKVNSNHNTSEGNGHPGSCASLNSNNRVECSSEAATLRDAVGEEYCQNRDTTAKNTRLVSPRSVYTSDISSTDEAMAVKNVEGAKSSPFIPSGITSKEERRLTRTPSFDGTLPPTPSRLPHPGPSEPVSQMNPQSLNSSAADAHSCQDEHTELKLSFEASEPMHATVFSEMKGSSQDHSNEDYFQYNGALNLATIQMQAMRKWRFPNRADNLPKPSFQTGPTSNFYIIIAALTGTLKNCTFCSSGVETEDQAFSAIYLTDWDSPEIPALGCFNFGDSEYNAW
ncbi:hypothetical protein BKA70DRAFT_1234908 [Coprinopsis sp. MPI-PUGE-AT-0042]|nr:hypothetical protein BKA70DRAFT_1234908 [Coprinopsis sp. MPI-PUGE-AT-0042]